METIGERLKKLRLLKNLTLQEVAEVLGTSKGNISNYETNKIKPSADSIIELSKLFNVSTDYILTGSNHVAISSEHNCNKKYNFSEEELYIVHLFRKLDHYNKLQLEEYMEDKIIEQKQNKQKSKNIISTSILKEISTPV